MSRSPALLSLAEAHKTRAWMRMHSPRHSHSAVYTPLHRVAVYALGLLRAGLAFKCINQALDCLRGVTHGLALERHAKGGATAAVYPPIHVHRVHGITTSGHHHVVHKNGDIGRVRAHEAHAFGHEEHLSDEDHALVLEHLHRLNVTGRRRNRRLLWPKRALLCTCGDGGVELAQPAVALVDRLELLAVRHVHDKQARGQPEAPCGRDEWREVRKRLLVFGTEEHD
mmetsp:Transcript_28079/g.65602  ORF Transcript_28079/g.65602 Transcript_28079/m.65602 type:complete len:226 (+) Transcript_28079:237-914(+)